MSEKYFLILVLLIFVFGAISAVNASDCNVTDDVGVSDCQSDVMEVENQDFADDDGNSDESETELQKGTMTVKKVTAYYNSNAKVKVKVVDVNGTPMKDVTVFMFVEGKNDADMGAEDTDANGVATFKVKKDLNVGTYSVESISFDFDYGTDSVKSTLVIKPKPVILKISKDVGAIGIFVKDKKTKKAVNGVKLTVKIYTGKKYKTVKLVSGSNKKITKNKGFCAFMTNDLSVGRHKVVIKVSSKNYVASKTAKVRITKSIKKDGSFLALYTRGKLKYCVGF